MATISSNLTIYLNTGIGYPLFTKKPLVSFIEIADIINGNVNPEKLG